MSHAPLILIIDDDPEIRDVLCSLLEIDGYRVCTAEGAYKGLVQARQEQPDLILLDRQLPEMDGLEICRRLRKTIDTPIILLTSLGQASQRVDGLDSGADDYITKPFEPNELLARIRVQLRRSRRSADRLQWQELGMNETLHEVRWRERPIPLTPKEYDLMRLFLQQPDKVLERREVLQSVWGWDSDGQDKVLDVTIHTLRQKIEAVTGLRLIHTVRGIGFILRLGN